MITHTYRPEGARIAEADNLDYLRTRAGLLRAIERQVILEAPAVLCDHRFDLHVSLPAPFRGIIERDEVQYVQDGDAVKDIAILTRVGKPVCFKVLALRDDEDGGVTVFLSRRAAQRDCMLNYVSTLMAGDVIPTRITHLEGFGAFVDIGCGIVSLLSIDCISVSRIAHPSARLSVGEELFAVVKSIDERGRIYVTERELLGTWEENAALFSEGQTVRGIVRSVESYGIFVELTPNLAGLAEYKDGVRQGQGCAVYIKSILPDKMKVKLIIIDTFDAPTVIEPLRYFIDPEQTPHIDEWLYSPPTAHRRIETIFR